MKSVLLVLISFLVFSLFTQVRAESLKDHELSAIWRAGSATELKTAVNSLTRLQKLRIQCSLQLKSDRVPIHCFEVLLSENQAGLIRAASLLSQEKWLKNVCFQKVDTSRDWQELSVAQMSSALPSECRSRAEQRLKDLHYQSEKENPSLLFESRHGKMDGSGTDRPKN